MKKHKHCLYTLKELNECVYCGLVAMTEDHVIPISASKWIRIKGYSSSRTRSILDNDSNKVSCCIICNREKSNLMPDEWFNIHPEYIERFKSNARHLSDLVKQLCGIYEIESRYELY